MCDTGFQTTFLTQRVRPAARLLLAAAASMASRSLPLPVVMMLVSRPRECLELFRDSVFDAVWATPEVDDLDLVEPARIASGIH